MKYVVTSKDRHGNTVRYYRPPGAAKKIRLREEPGSLEFQIEYDHAAAGTTLPAPKVVSKSTDPITGIRPGSLRELCADYYRDIEFKSLGDDTRHAKRGYLENICMSLHNGKKRGDLPYAEMQRKHVIQLQRTITPSLSSADAHIKALRSLFNWAIMMEKVAVNPVSLVKPIAKASKGSRPWKKEDFAAFVKAYPLGTTEFLAVAIMRYTAVRMSDAIRLGPQHIRTMKGVKWLCWTEYKNGHSNVIGNRAPKPKERRLQLHPALAQVIEVTPSVGTHLLMTGAGIPFTDKYFMRWFGDRCDRVGLKDCRSHGIRKYVLTTLAEGGATPHELMGVSGHTSAVMLTPYTDTVDRARMGSDAILSLK